MYVIFFYNLFDIILFSVISDKCGGTLYSPKSGVITSPDYPDTYPNNVDCNWRLVASESHVFNFNFTHFNIGPYTVNLKNECPSDTDTLSVTWVLPGVKVNSEFLVVIIIIILI